jgi:sugar phosphate isomerase/epimerase
LVRKALPNGGKIMLLVGKRDAQNAKERFSIERCLEICDQLQLRSILAVAGYDRGAFPLEILIEAFADLCDRAAQQEVWVDLEFMPFWGLPDLGTAWTIVQGAGRSNAGIMIDTWHFSKGAPDLELLRSLPAERFVNLQVADALQQQRGSTLVEDTVRYRMFPGEGELPLVEILSVLHAKGYLRSIGPKIFSDEADAMSPMRLANARPSPCGVCWSEPGSDTRGSQGSGS